MICYYAKINEFSQCRERYWKIFIEALIFHFRVTAVLENLK